MIRFLIATISFFCFTQSVSAQSAGPLGFTWGEGSNQLEAIEQIDLSREYSILSEDNQRYCAREIIAGVIRAPGSWKLDYRRYVMSGSFFEVSDNSAQADLSMDGRLTAYLYNVNVLGEDMIACGAFLDGQLYSVHIEISNFFKEDGISELLKDALSQNYGVGNTVCGANLCSTLWLSEEKKVTVDYTQSRAGGLTYTYGPLKAQQVEAWAEYYVNFVKSATAGSDL